jgi:hypothetical protein
MGGVPMTNKRMLSLVTQFEEAIEKGKITDSLFQNVLEVTDRSWNSAKYSIEEVTRLCLVKEFIQIADYSLINHFFGEAKLQLTQKDRKKGKKAVFTRVKRRWHQKNVRDTFDDFLSVMAKAPAKTLADSPTEETLADLIEFHKFDFTYWIIVYYLKHPTLRTLIEKDYPYDTLSFRSRTYELYVSEDFESIMERPQLLEYKRKEKSEQLKKENQKLKKQIVKTQKKKLNLEHSVSELRQAKKKLDRDLQELYDSALSEIEELKGTLKDLESNFQTERNTYYTVIEQLLKQLNAETVPEPTCDKLNLNGRKICVIGGERERGYTAIVEKYNGKLRYIPASDFHKIDGAIQESDAVFFLTEMVGHKHFYRAYETSKKCDKKFIFVNSLGRHSFERELKGYLHQSLSITPLNL